MKVYFFDVETTGLGEKDRLIQLAILERGALIPLVDALFKPPVPIEVEAMSIHHITPQMVQDRPEFNTSPEFIIVEQAFADDEAVVVAHNATFDLSMLKREGITPKRAVCTRKVAHAVYPNLTSFKLQSLRYNLNLAVDGEAHSAIGDVFVLSALFERLVECLLQEHYQESDVIEEMIAISSRPTLYVTFPFGKYKGETLANVCVRDRGYLTWLLANMGNDPQANEDWLYSLRYHLYPEANP